MWENPVFPRRIRTTRCRDDRVKCRWLIINNIPSWFSMDNRGYNAKRILRVMLPNAIVDHSRSISHAFNGSTRLSAIPSGTDAVFLSSRTCPFASYAFEFRDKSTKETEFHSLLTQLSTEHGYFSENSLTRRLPRRSPIARAPKLLENDYYHRVRVEQKYLVT